MADKNVKFSKRQQEAIDWDNNRELLISAAAGSGKTTVLISRIIDRIVNKRIPIESFLVVTFTHASANELREKIVKALNDALKLSPEDEWLSVQLANVGRASIGTMHSFCLKAIKDYHEHPTVQLPKSVRIINEEKSGQLLDEAIDEVMTDEYSKADNESFLHMLDVYASFRNDDNVRGHIKSLYRFALNNRSPYEWLSKQEQTESDSSYINLYCGFIRKTALEAKLMCDAVLKDFSASSKYEDMLKLCSDTLQKLMNALECGNYIKANNIIINDFDFIAIRGGKIKDENVAVQRNVLKYIKKGFLNFAVMNADDDTQTNYDETKKALSELCRITALAGRRFEEKKRKIKSVDYSDMEHMTLELLNDEGVAELYRSKFRHIMFDEYQDCNRIQEMIVRKISGNAVYFMVGDVKQSIYGFRQAEPGLFLEKYLSYKYDPNAEYAVIELNENYRSRKNVLNAANKIFFGIMRKDFCGMDYCKDNALNAMAHYPESTEDTFADEPVRLALMTGKNLSAQCKLQAQIMYAINYIRTVMKSKKVYDARKGEYRRMKYSDIAILMRSPKNSVSAVREIFAATDIPINILQDSDIRYAPEINLIMCILQCIENPYNDIALMATLHCYIFDVTDNGLLCLMNFDKDGPRDVISKIQNYIKKADSCPEGGQRDELYIKLKRFTEKYSEWIENARYLPVIDFIDYIIDTTGYMEYFGSFENGRSRKDNILRLYETLRQQLEISGGGLFECCRILKNIDENGIAGGNAAQSPDAVSVMSIHKSKGLEFPVVFIMDADRAFSDDEIKKTILIHKDYGAISKKIDAVNRIEYSTPEYEILKRIIKKEQREEEQRILYVAMTRAKEQLIIMGAVSDKTLENGCMGESLPEIASANNFLKWILYALCSGQASAGYPVSAESLSGTFDTNVQRADYGSRWSVDVCMTSIDQDGKCVVESKFDGKITLLKLVERLGGADTSEGETNFRNNILPDIAELEKKLSFRYAHDEATRINSKFSVSQIKHIAENLPDDDTYEIPDYRYDKIKVISSDNVITPTKLGTLYHFFMQHASNVYPYGINDFESDIEKMLAKRLITKSEAEYLNPSKFEAFFNSDVGKRMSEAVLVEKEKSFTYYVEAKNIFPTLKTDEKIIVQGVIDCYFQDKNGNYVLIDYKTDRIAPGMESRLAEKHKKQIELYKSAMSDIMDIYIKEAYIYSFALESFIPVII